MNDISTDTITLTFDAEDIRIPPDQAARYAGGTQYRPDDRMGRFIDTALEQAMGLVSPAFAYALHAVENRSDGAAGGISVRRRAAAVCTLGPDLEAEVKRLNTGGDPVGGLLLDAAGVAMLESLAGQAMTHLGDAARQEGLYAGNRYGPGYCGMPITDQPLLFTQVDAHRIGVRLTGSGMMQPVKSLSFWVDWQTAPSAASGTYKCRRCTLKDCAYRLHAGSGSAHG